MPTRQKRPLGRRIQARMMNVVNIPMRRILGLPFPTPLGGRLMLTSLTGRRTGRVYRQPLSYVEHEGALLTPGGGNWKLNLRNGTTVKIRLRGRDVLARAELVRDIDEIERLLGIMTGANPSVGAFVGVPKGPDGRLDRARLRTAVEYGFCIVRWQLSGPPSG